MGWCVATVWPKSHQMACSAVGRLSDRRLVIRTARRLLGLALCATVASSDDRPWAVVTGASSGIGRECARECARRGYNVCLAARRKDRLQTLAIELMERDSQQLCAIVPVDLTSEVGVERLHEAASELSPSLVILNAGLCEPGRLVHQDSAQVAAMLNLNVASSAALLRHFAADMAASRQGGRILIVGSSAGAMPGIPGVAVYAATKAFLRSLAAGVGAEVRPSGVCVTYAMPCAVDTEFAAVSGLQRARVFSLPGVRQFGSGVVLPADAVASAAVEATVRGKREVVPGFVPRLFVGLADRRILPTRVSRAIAAFAFSTPAHRAEER